MITFLFLVAAVLATWFICKRIYGKPQGKWQQNTDLPDKYEIRNPDDVLEFYKDISSKLFQSEECVPEDVRKFFDEQLNSKNIESMCRVADFFERELVIVKKGVEVEESEEQQEEMCEQVEEVKEVEPTQIDLTEEEHKREEKEEIEEGEQEYIEEHEPIDIEENEQDSNEELSEEDTQDKETYIAFFDVETSGLTPPSMYEIMQLSYIITTLDWNIVKRVNHYFPYPDEDRIEFGAMEKNGLTKEFLDKQTLSSRKEALEQFFSDMKDVGLVVAHNAEFDIWHIDSAAERYGVLTEQWPNVYDTMKETTDFCAIPSSNLYYDDYKWPKLSELAACLDVEYDEARLHNSMADVELTMECFKKLYAMGGVLPINIGMRNPRYIIDAGERRSLTEGEFYAVLTMMGVCDFDTAHYLQSIDLYSRIEGELTQYRSWIKKATMAKLAAVRFIQNENLCRFRLRGDDSCL